MQDVLRVVAGEACVDAEMNGMAERIWSQKHAIAYFGKKFQSVHYFKHNAIHSI